MYLIHCKILFLAILIKLDVFTFIEADPHSHRTNVSYNRTNRNPNDNYNRDRQISSQHRAQPLTLREPRIHSGKGPPSQQFTPDIPQNQQIKSSVPKYQPITLDIKRHNTEKFYYIEDHQSRTFSFFPRGPNLISKVVKEHHLIWESDGITYSDYVTVRYFDDRSPIARVNFITQLPKFKYIDLFLDYKASTDVIHYETFENKHYFIPKFSYLIRNAYMGSKCVWSYHSGDYPEEVVLTTLPNTKPRLKVLFPRDESQQGPYVPRDSNMIARKRNSMYLSQILSEPEDSSQTHPKPLNLAQALGEPQPAKSSRSAEVKPREQSASRVQDRRAVQAPDESRYQPDSRQVSHKPKEPLTISVKLAEPSKESESDSSASTTDEKKATDLISINVNKGGHTAFYDYFEDETSAIYELRGDYKLFSLKDENDGTIWKAKNRKHYAIKAVRNGLGTNTDISKASVFLKNGTILHLIKSYGKWNVRSNAISLDITAVHSNLEYEYTRFEKSEYFEAKHNFRFRCIRESDIKIWLADEKEHANTVIVTKMDNGDRILVVHLTDPYLRLFKQQNGGSWVRNKDFVPVPTELDITRPKRSEYEIFTHIAKQGYVFNKIKDGRKLVWKPDLPEHYAKRVVASGIGRKSVILTIHQIDGHIKKIFRPQHSKDFVEIDSKAQIPVTININSVTNCRAYYTYKNDNVRVFRVRGDYIIAGIREKSINCLRRESSNIIWRASNKEAYVNRVELLDEQSDLKEINLFHANGEQSKFINKNKCSSSWQRVSF